MIQEFRPGAKPENPDKKVSVTIRLPKAVKAVLDRGARKARRTQCDYISLLLLTTKPSDIAAIPGVRVEILDEITE